jgi:hypothetical protein
MSIPVTCTCGQQFMAQPHLAGQRVACPNCGNPLTIPASNEQATATIEEVPSSNIVSCQCGQSFKAPPHLAGKRVPCPSCGQPIDIPGGPSGGGSEPRSPAASPSPPKKSRTAAGATPRKRPAAAAAPGRNARRNGGTFRGGCPAIPGERRNEANCWENGLLAVLALRKVG